MSSLQSALEPVFEENFALRGEIGASLSIWRDGREIVSLAGGFRDRDRTQPWDAGALVLVYSSTKGPSAACVLKCLDDAGIPLDAPVSSVWPGFAHAGKGAITFAQVLSHRGGLPALDEPPNVFDYPAVIRALERQAPLWPPGDGHGYHPRTCGFIWNEIVERVAGRTIGAFWRETFRESLSLDFWIGLPPERLPDVSPLFPPRNPPAGDEFLKAFVEAGSLTNRAFGSPCGLGSVSSMNTPHVREANLPAFGGIGTASALARFYSVLAAGGEPGGLVTPAMVTAMTTRLSNGFDRVLRIETAFSAGFLQDPAGPDGKKLRCNFGPSLGAFGHVGSGGSLGFADPERGIGFGYVMNQMEPGVLANAKSLHLIERMYEALDHGTID